MCPTSLHSHKLDFPFPRASFPLSYFVPSSSLLSVPFQPHQTRKHKQFSEHIVVKYSYKQCSNAAEFKENGIEP